MSRKYKFEDQTYPYFVSLSVVHWIDIFTRPEYRNIVLDSLSYCQKRKGLIIYAWCIMTNHLHLIIGTNASPMQEILRDMKRFTSKKLRDSITDNGQESRKKWILWMMKQTGRKNNNNHEWQFWQQHNHPIELSNETMIRQRLDYLHNNPVSAGYVQKPENWLYSSAGDYCGRKGFLDIEVID